MQSATLLLVLLRALGLAGYNGTIAAAWRSYSSPTAPRCRSQYPIRVAFVGHHHDLRSWISYEGGDGYLGSETYWSSSIHYALHTLNISVDFYPTQPILLMHGHTDPQTYRPTQHSLRSDMAVLQRAAATHHYHRLIMAGYAAERLRELVSTLEDRLLCRTRVFAWWDVGLHATRVEKGGVDNWMQFDKGTEVGGRVRRNETGARVSPQVDPRLVVTPHASPSGPELASVVPYFPHSRVTLPPSTNAARPRAGFILGKSCFVVNRHPHIIRALLEHGFELHSVARCPHLGGHWNTSTLSSSTDSPSSPHLNSSSASGGRNGSIITHGLMSPTGFAKALRGMSFLLGVGSISVSPSPLEALANGAAFLNPRNGSHSQHPPLAAVGAPYVYNYELGVPASVVDAAECAVRARFASYTPLAHMLETTLAAVCANLIDQDAPCACVEAKEAGDQSYPACRRAVVPTDELANLVASDDDNTEIAAD